ncbi:MAG: PD-(D/E)XK nuclease superfamily protein [Candidatus Diapherotrites archaeon ADurb.Bin253]|jgi:CRISPR/Cas system-associated exonuclease Cas4 (RecB family)|nr:MAG: PD-(D/E)XK nuclease superfamily protein [Candidatus Diapherotrites archaeon ADurb.Bin253]HNZ51832.1 PD-(D/E)XK nuclease family protein [Candidatus Pacearchaeota archaeon]HOC97288.1 PD-(D/E)XK nuclease family protein [Candidatus Pacearchaeota archaeon]HOF44089.1 PD-(D/E)XK nuclease family protein [Candidatus Pacearchaeota archaeon]HOH04194.1 PD-(D/E)XK nuclease family protein [Candidatus Pacearchaeota archaeon]
MSYKLSPSKLNLFLECPLCFWLNEKGVHRPSGPFPSLPGGIDRKLKIYFDKYRKQGKLPPELQGKVEGKLYDNLEKMDTWRNARKGISWTDEEGNTLFGAIDECLIDKDNFIVVDFKTYGGSKVEDDKINFYQNQLDCYALLFEKNKLKHPGYAYLIFFMPLEVKENGKIDFKIEVKKVKVDSKRALKNFKEAIKLIKSERPKNNSECKFCSWAREEWNSK